VRCHVEFVAAIDEAARVVALVSSECDALLAGQVVVHHRERSLALGGPGRRRDLYFDEQPISILHQRVLRIGKLGLFASGLLAHVHVEEGAKQ
jgi:hypothetical protein